FRPLGQRRLLRRAGEHDALPSLLPRILRARSGPRLGGDRPAARETPPPRSRGGGGGGAARRLHPDAFRRPVRPRRVGRLSPAARPRAPSFLPCNHVTSPSSGEGRPGSPPPTCSPSKTS